MATTRSDLDYRIEAGEDFWPKAGKPHLRSIAEKAQKIAEETERRGREEGWSFLACQSEYGCDWSWKAGELDTPTARVYDCDGETIEVVS